MSDGPQRLNENEDQRRVKRHNGMPAHPIFVVPRTAPKSCCPFSVWSWLLLSAMRALFVSYRSRIARRASDVVLGDPQLVVGDVALLAGDGAASRTPRFSFKELGGPLGGRTLLSILLSLSLSLSLRISRFAPEQRKEMGQGAFFRVKQIASLHFSSALIPLASAQLLGAEDPQIYCD